MGKTVTYAGREYDLQTIIAALKASSNLITVIRQIGLPVAGSSYRFLNDVIEAYEIDISHHKGQGWAAGLTLADPVIRNRASRMPPTRRRLKKAEKEALARQQQMEQA